LTFARAPDLISLNPSSVVVDSPFLRIYAFTQRFSVLLKNHFGELAGRVQFTQSGSQSRRFIHTIVQRSVSDEVEADAVTRPRCGHTKNAK
jgi:hypothetical protein